MSIKNISNGNLFRAVAATREVDKDALTPENIAICAQNAYQDFFLKERRPLKDLLDITKGIETLIKICIEENK